MSDAIEQFCAAHFDYNALSAKRRTDVRRALLAYAAHAGVPIETTGAREFRAWLESLIAAGRHPNTVRWMGNCVRPFFRWAWRDAELVTAETYMRIKEVPNPKGASAQGPPRPYSRKELTLFWRAMDARWPTAAGARAWPRFIDGRARFPRVADLAMHHQLDAIVHLALHCGLRRAEVYAATLDDVHYDNEYVVVRKGKGGKYREVPYTDDARDAMRRWLGTRAVIMRHFEVDHGSVWLSLSRNASMNNPLMPSTPAAPMNVRRFGEMMSTMGEWEMHRFRHTCGTEWLRAGMPLEKVQVLLGHARITQTLGYAKVAGSDVGREARAAETKFADAVRRAA